MLCSDLVSENVDIDKKEEPVVVLPITDPSMFRSPSNFRGWQSIINFQSLVVIHKTSLFPFQTTVPSVGRS